MKKISIQICTYNRAGLIENAIESVLRQTYTDWEILILDDNSKDNTEEIVKKYLSDSRIRYIKNEHNLGIAKNRNKGLSLSTGKYIAVLDSDDLWIDNKKLEKQIDFIENNPEYHLVGTNFNIINSENVVLKTVRNLTKNDDIKNKMLIKNNFCHSSVLFNRLTALNAKGYDEQLDLAEDYDLYLKIGIKHKICNLIDISTSYRIHNNQSYTNKTKLGYKIQKSLITKYRKYYSHYYFAIIFNNLRYIRNLTSSYVRQK